jgi:serine phosphatase RsbU (regulator of sigma subunit)
MPRTEERERGLGETLLSDIKSGNVISDLRTEAREIRDFYLSDDKRERVRSMARPKGWFFVGWWILKSMFLKLTPFRRILLVFGILFVVSTTRVVSIGDGAVSRDVQGPLFIGLLAILLVLMLELKDKLLAHSELREGRAIQRALQPEANPSVEGWRIWLFTRPANEVCGDIIDFFSFNGGEYGIATGDVAGKGLGAALLMVKIQATVRALAPEVATIKDLAFKLNGILLRDRIPTRFASLIFLKIEKGSATVRYVNAGHMPPLLVTKGEIQEFQKGNPALGLSAEVTFEERTCTLAPHQTLVLYSDGITEAENEAGGVYGVERLKALCTSLVDLDAVAFGEGIVRDVEGFVHGARMKDDISLAILQRSNA